MARSMLRLRPEYKVVRRAVRALRQRLLNIGPGYLGSGRYPEWDKSEERWAYELL